MSGYQALRASDPGDSIQSVSYRHRVWNAEEPDGPVVLARVADFRADPDEPCEEPFDESCEALDDDLSATHTHHVSQAVEALRSRLTTCGLVLVAAIVGFVLGRMTSPDSPQDPDLWRPAPTTAEASAWQSESPPTETSGTRPETSFPSPWTAPDADEPAQSQSAWPAQVERSADTGGPTQWNNNRPMQLPPAQPVGQSDRRSFDADRDEPTRVARRPDAILPNVQPDSSVGRSPIEQPPTQMPREYPGSYSRTTTEPANAANAQVPQQGCPSTNYPTTNYPTTGYPNTYPPMRQATEPQSNGNAPAAQNWPSEAAQYPY